jgi:plasmid stabilization system protein ParE
MAITLNDDEIKIKPAIPSLKCEIMLNNALAYLAKQSLKQARIMNNQFYEIIGILEKFPGIGTMCENGRRKIKLGKFRYNIYYRENEDNIDILGIWHTSRGTEFEEN